MPIELVGAHLAIPQVVNMIGVFAVAGLENALLARGLSLLGVRRLASSAASVLTAAALLLFGLARTAPQATAAYCALKAAETLHSSGLSSNRLEVGGPDMGMISSVANCNTNAIFFWNFLLKMQR